MKGVRKQRQASKFTVSNLRALSGTELKALSTIWNDYSSNANSTDTKYISRRIAQKIEKVLNEKSYSAVEAYELRQNPNNNIKYYSTY